MRQKIFLFSVFVFCFAARTLAQTYPSALSTVLTNPKTLFLDEYADPFQPRIKTTIYFTDFTEVSWAFALKLKITGPNGIVIQTKPGLRPATPVIVSPGQPYELQGADLAFYFNYSNLYFTNISKAQLEISNRLPEGLYTFCFEAVDYESGKTISRPGCATAYLTLNDPAIILNPVCGSVVETISLQNILFQWQLSNANGNLNLSQLTYQIDLYEVNTSWTNPSTAILNNQALPIWQSSPLQLNNYLYAATDPPLEKGKRYVFTVRTLESNGRSSFKNNGYSTPCHFHFGYYENDTIDVIEPENDFQFTLGTPSKFKWKKPRKALPNQLVTYTLKLVEIEEDQSPEDAILNNDYFYQQEYLAVNDQEISKTVPVMFWANIKRMGKYAWQVYAQSGTQQIAKSKVQTFTGPPEIESFIAGGFLMSVTKLTNFDKVNNVISGKCKTKLSKSSTETEFAYSNITISPLGDNEWVMISGSFADKVECASYTLQPQTYADNKTAVFKPDSVIVGVSNLKLSGKVEWNFPHAGVSQEVEKLISERCLLTLANTSFYLNNSYSIPLKKDYQIAVMEPYGFTVKLDQSSELSIYQSKYEFNFNGYVQLPSKVINSNNSATHIAFENMKQLHYISQHANPNSESIMLARNTKFGMLPTHYILDFSEKQSPGEFEADSSWKGLYIDQAKLQLPKSPETSGQITLPFAREFDFVNTTNDTNKAYVTNRGLSLNTTIPFQTSDSLRFMTFTSKLGYFHAKINESEIDRAFISGGIYIPVIDTVKSFPYRIEMTDYGFNEGYLVNGLTNTTFTFNGGGGAEQKIPITIKRAVFKGKNHLEMDLDMSWPYFKLNLKGVQRFSVWGNGNIGFDVPNGKAALTYQATGKASNFDITVDYLGCGRNGNAYAFGASAKINMDEEISGETGPPVINAYSIYKNPLLSGSVSVTSTVASSGSTASSTSFQSSTSGYTAALVSDLNTAFTDLGVNATAFNGTPSVNIETADSISKNDPLIKNNLITDMGKVIDVIYRLKPFIQEVTEIADEDWASLDIVNLILKSDVAKKSETLNAKELMNYVLLKVLDEIVFRINKPIQDVSDKAMTKVRTAINTRVVVPINSKIDQNLGSIFEKLEIKLKAQVDEEYHAVITTVFASVRNNIVAGVKNSVANSFETNITSKITNFVQLGVTAKVKGFVKQEVTAAGLQLINNGVNATINLNSILQNSGTMFESIADTIRDVIMTISAANLLNTGESLVEDAINGIDWNAISNQILNELLVQGISNAVASSITQSFGASAGPYASAILSTVKFDFNNIGSKLKNGEFDKIVKFDPTTIYLVTPALDVRGTLIFTKDDPVYGDSWQADVLVRVKVPNKDNPIEITAFFLNGKTTQLAQNFTYWFAKLSVTGFTIPLNPVPVVWYGVEGFAYSKMKRNTPTQVVPDKQNKFGIGCKFYFYDQPTSGKTYMFDLGAEAEFNDGGFYIQLVGNASVLNYLKNNEGKYQSPGFITGSGYLGYYKTPECKKIAGNFSVKLNTEPIICAGGDVGLDLRGPNNWKVWAGTQKNPIGVKILCKDFLSNTSFMEVSNTGMTAGLAMNVAISAQSPWVEFTGIKIRGFANLNFGYNAYTSISWDPTFTINEASISAWLSANVGIDYETSAASNSLTLAGISLSGILTYKSQPESELHGSMSGSITVLGFHLGFDAPINYSLSKQQIIN
ncbi:hypothetical protein CNR22_12065 [Sphingobacteriaceae bacterium]|nr:hypothetical protein CNR22_12065 [Sphingobacteriaceae bacterium]